MVCKERNTSGGKEEYCTPCQGNMNHPKNILPKNIESLISKLKLSNGVEVELQMRQEHKNES